MVDEIPSIANIEKFRSALQHLPDRIVTLWRGLVATDVIADPVAGQDGAEEQIAYGATCLAACLGLDFSFYAQIGDGDLVAMKADGTLVKPLPDDKGLVGEQTYSLCQPDAAKRFRTLFQLAPQDLAVPEFVLAATDGLAKSFSKDSQFFDVVRQLAKLSSDRGIQALSKDLELWLSEVSEHGSGDDITLMIFKDSRDRVFSKMQLTGWEYMIEKLQRLLR